MVSASKNLKIGLAQGVPPPENTKLHFLLLYSLNTQNAAGLLGAVGWRISVVWAEQGSLFPPASILYAKLG